MLKNIPPCISPDLMHALMSTLLIIADYAAINWHHSPLCYLAGMGHGDTIVIADGNFPAASHAQRLIRASGLGVTPLLDAILQVFPLDEYDAENAVRVMQVVPGDKNSLATPPIWADFERVVTATEGSQYHLQPIERFQFYTEAKKAYAIIATSETAIYANVILKKGIIKSQRKP